MKRLKILKFLRIWQQLMDGIEAISQDFDKSIPSKKFARRKSTLGLVYIVKS